MYGLHFGLASAPFRITPDTRRFYPGAQRGAVLDALVYAVQQGEGIIKLTGEVGSGKTMLCRMMVDRLSSYADVVYLANPSLEREDVLKAIALELGLNISADRMQLLHDLQQSLIKRHVQGRRTAVFVEEAQAMNLETLEEIRLLSNLETEEDKLLQIVLFGQPELDDKLNAYEVRQLRDRITYSFELAPLSSLEIQDYIPFRLRAAGYQGGEPFSPQAYRLLARASQGLIRRVHVLADKALLAAFTDGSRQVTPHHMRQAIADTDFTKGGWLNLASLSLPTPGWGMAAASLIAVAGIAGLLHISQAGQVLSASTPALAQAPLVSQEQVAAFAAIAPAAGKMIPATTQTAFEQRLQRTDQLLKENVRGQYTIQVMTSDSADPEALRDVFKEAAAGHYLDALYVAPTRIAGQRRWSVTYGAFTSISEAQQALRSLPAPFKQHGPYLRSLSAIKKEAVSDRSTQQDAS